MDETGANESITLFADFDSANMARYERVYNKNGQNQFMTSSSNNFFNATLEDRLVAGLCLFCLFEQNSIEYSSSCYYADSSSEQIKAADVPNVDIEFNVWTKPDCEATPFVNGNRSVFHLVDVTCAMCQTNSMENKKFLNFSSFFFVFLKELVLFWRERRPRETRALQYHESEQAS
jgi:hypothetical protein